ncbi:MULTISPECIES: Lrp/AsnC family transcriptional regulator [unclassified Plantibacter]|jgi:Lrp/AsnC family leucine-responsive transcriptional regulator|uniref:Lrp/AsnC family transcriptional regulator n=1 Tax=unclassified Plantibacter TaxID=2624265 RepID=UPI003D331380
MQLDDTHVRMLEVLRDDGRTSVAALAEHLGISRSNAYARYEAMVRAGVIRGVHADIDPSTVGLGVAAMVFITLRQSQWADFRARLSSVQELEYFAVTTGEHDAMLLVRAPDVAAIHELVATQLAQWPSIKATTTVFLMDEERASVSLRMARSERTSVEDSGERFGMTRFVRTSDERAQRVPDRRGGR